MNETKLLVIGFTAFLTVSIIVIGLQNISENISNENTKVQILNSYNVCVQSKSENCDAFLKFLKLE